MSIRLLALACLVIALAACKPSTPADAATPAQTEPAGTLEKAAAALNPLSSPEDEMKASMDKFLKARSFHAVMDMQGARSMAIEMDFVAPDRYRMKMPTGNAGDHRRHHVHAGRGPLDEGAVAPGHADPVARPAARSRRARPG